MLEQLLEFFALRILPFVVVPFLAVIWVYLLIDLREGRAWIMRHPDAVDAVIDTVRITTRYRPYRANKIQTDPHKNEVYLNVNTAMGLRRYKTPELDVNILPKKIRKQIYRYSSLRKRYLLRISDDVERQRVKEIVDQDGYEFRLPTPLQAKVIVPTEPNQRLRWRVI